MGLESIDPPGSVSYPGVFFNSCNHNDLAFKIARPIGLHKRS